MTKITNELEQPIMDCWTIVDNLKSVMSGINRKELTPTQIHAVLNGLAVLYEIKFNTLFNLFEEVLRDNAKKSND